ncbi:MAG: hypothetical protein LAT56_10020 [Wenzhouxiangella sp.]|nr:hypothetical protein [Wenzhouxiangella sp.]
MKKIVFLSLFIGVFLQSCRIHPYQTTFKRYQIKKSVYEEGDAVFVGDYVVCKNLRKSFRNLEFPGNHDHYINNFLHAIEGRLNVSVLENSQNRCDSIFFKNHRLNPKKMDVDNFPELFRIRKKGIHLVPLIYVDNMWMSSMYITSSGSAGTTGTGKDRTTFLKISVYIYHDAELVYQKLMWYRAKPRDIRDDFEDDFNLNQGHWDTLVKKVLDEYIVY